MNTAKGVKPMDDVSQPAGGRVVLEPFSYVPPPDYADVTNYAYRGDREVPRLKVHYVASLDELGGLDAALTDYQLQVERYLKAHIESVSPVPETRGELTVRSLVFTFRGTGPKDPCPTYREWCGFGRFASGAGVQVEYVTSGDDTDGARVYETVISGVRLVETVAPGAQLVPGCVYRAAGAVMLPVPVTLKPPSTRHYVYEAGVSRSRLSLQFAEDTGVASSMIGKHLESLGADGGQAPAVGPLPSRVVTTATRSGANGAITESVCHWTKPVAGGFVIITGQATADLHDKMMTDLDRLADGAGQGWR
jgi:hypothetical protein